MNGELKMSCKYQRIRSKKYQKYFYCNHPDIKSEIDKDDCDKCKLKGYKEIKPIKGKKKDMIHCPVLEQGTYIDMLSGKEYVSENIENESFYNGDITEYRGMVKLELNPYSVIVISKKQGGCKNEEKKKITGNFTHNHNELGRFNGVWKIASRI